MTREEIKAKVIDLVGDLFSDLDFDKDILEYIDLIDDAGMDSITFISIVIEIEAVFEITVPDDMLLMEYFRNVDAIMVIVEQEINKLPGEIEE